MNSRRLFLGGAALAGAAAVSRSALAALPDAATAPPPTTMAPPLQPQQRPTLPPGGHAQRLDAALAHEGRLEGIPPRGRAGAARAGARHDGAAVGLQRQLAGSDHRGRRRRPRAPVRHQQAARAHRRALAWPAPAQRHGRCRRADAAADPAGQDLRLRVRGAAQRHLHVPPACRRDGADGDGHDGPVDHAPEASRSAPRATARSTATSASCSMPSTSNRAAPRRRS